MRRASALRLAARAVGSTTIAGDELLKAVDDDAVAGLEAVDDQPAVARSRVRAGPAATRRAIVVAHDEHFARAGIVAADRLLRHRERVGIDALLDLHAHIHAGQQRRFGFGNSPRSVTWPVLGSTVMSENSSLPSWG